eukprot:ctg_1373.g372
MWWVLWALLLLLLTSALELGMAYGGGAGTMASSGDGERKETPSGSFWGQDVFRVPGTPSVIPSSGAASTPTPSPSSTPTPTPTPTPT